MATSNNSNPQIDMFIDLMRDGNFRNKVVYSILWVLGSKEDCEDVFQETSIAIFLLIKKGHFSQHPIERSSFEKYFFRVAKNKGFQKAGINLKRPSLGSNIAEAEQETTNFEYWMSINLKGLEFVLSQNQNTIWDLLKKDSSITEISDLMGKSYTTINFAIFKLKQTIYKFGIAEKEFEKYGGKTCQKRISELSVKLGISQRTLQFYLNCWQR